VSVEHPSGELTVEIELGDGAQGLEVVRSSLVRTARALFTGQVFVPSAVWNGQRQASTRPRKKATAHEKARVRE
jgi:hypothetical protein